MEEMQGIYRNKKRLAKFCSWDAIVLTHIGNLLFGSGTAAEREALLCRIEGKPRSGEDMIKENTKPTHVIVSWKERDDGDNKNP